MSSDSFYSWLATYWETGSPEVEKALREKVAVEFLIAWSVFETRCFDKLAQQGKFEKLADNTAKHGDTKDIQANAEYFHSRYQDKEKFRKLMYKENVKEANKVDKSLTEIIGRGFDTLDAKDKAYLVIWVVYRYRNNLFHGNKGVEGWLKYKDEIKKCRLSMQKFIDIKQSQTSGS